MGSIQVSKTLMRYTGIAPEAKQCQGCAHASCSGQTYASRLHCAKGGFFVAGVAGCKEWLPKNAEVAA
jgi:hypothetical protein